MSCVSLVRRGRERERGREGGKEGEKRREMPQRVVYLNKRFSALRVGRQGGQRGDGAQLLAAHEHLLVGTTVGHGSACHESTKLV